MKTNLQKCEELVEKMGVDPSVRSKVIDNMLGMMIQRDLINGIEQGKYKVSSKGSRFMGWSLVP